MRRRRQKNRKDGKLKRNIGTYVDATLMANRKDKAMVKVESIANEEKKGCNVSISMSGNSKELVEETLAAIQGVMGSLKEQDALLHLLAIRAIAENREILLGEEGDIAEDFERFVATTKFREGIN